VHRAWVQGRDGCVELGGWGTVKADR